ncbi:hypothetical protein [Lacticaseibacillus suihuaensis]
MIEKYFLDEGLSYEEIAKLFENFTERNADFIQLQTEKSSFPWITGEKGLAYPLEFHISLTNKCLLKSRHCYKGRYDIWS